MERGRVRSVLLGGLAGRKVASGVFTRKGVVVVVVECVGRGTNARGVLVLTRGGMQPLEIFVNENNTNLKENQCKMHTKKK